MTKKRNDNHNTEFGLWLREQGEIDSRLGFTATNVDYMWKNYKTGQYMLLEEKRYNSQISWWQRQMFKQLHEACKNDPDYKGFYSIIFENTSPDDGKIILSRKPITPKQLISFLKFELDYKDIN